MFSLSQGQIQKSTLSISGGHKEANGYTLIHSIGQSALIGQVNQGNKLLIHGFINPLKNYSNQPKIPVNWFVYPNPFDHQFTINFPFEIDLARIKLYDIRGAEIYHKALRKGLGNIEISQLSHLPTSTYLLVIEYNGKMYQRHLINEK